MSPLFHPVYRELQKILALRAQKLALRRGRQYLRQISGDGIQFGYPAMIGSEIRAIVPWSRIFDNHEILMALNTDYDDLGTAWTIVDRYLHRKGDRFTCSYSTDPAQLGEQLVAETLNDDTRAVRLTVPAAGFVIYE